jgi:formylmethanofuran dehydrogenase subunit C
MTTTTLRVKTPPGFRVDGARLLPQALARLAVAEIEHILLPAGSQTCRVGDLFDVSRSDAAAAPGTTGDPLASLLIEGNARWLDRLGAQLDGGRLCVHGSSGAYTGYRMAAGELSIHGDAGHFTACEMRGGRLTVTGNTGDFAAGALTGDMEGMSGGTLAVHGNAGARLADRMRRGLVLVGGDVGACAASRLVAGTIAIGGQLGTHYAYGMRRGTLLLAQAPARLPPTFTAGGGGFDVFWSLLARSLAREIEALQPAAALQPFSRLGTLPLPRRYAGDLAVDGRGEILIVG